MMSELDSMMARKPLLAVAQRVGCQLLLGDVVYRDDVAKRTPCTSIGAAFALTHRSSPMGARPAGHAGRAGSALRSCATLA